MTKYRRAAIERADGRQWRTIWTITQSFAHSHFISWLQTLVSCLVVIHLQSVSQFSTFKQFRSVLSYQSGHWKNREKHCPWPAYQQYQLTNIRISDVMTLCMMSPQHYLECQCSVNESITILQWSLICIFYVCSAVTLMAEAHKCLIRKEEYLQYKWRQKLHFYIIQFMFSKKKQEGNILLMYGCVSIRVMKSLSCLSRNMRIYITWLSAW